MSAATTKRKAKKTLKPVTGSARWVGGTPTRNRLDDGDAILRIAVTGQDEPTFYHVQSNKDGEKVVGYRLFKITSLDKTETYDLGVTSHGLTCDCADATYNSEQPGGCKHKVALSAALKAAGLN
jgi:hypothetical protein